MPSLYKKIGFESATSQTAKYLLMHQKLLQSQASASARNDKKPFLLKTKSKENFSVDTAAQHVLV